MLLLISLLRQGSALQSIKLKPLAEAHSISRRSSYLFGEGFGAWAKATADNIEALIVVQSQKHFSRSGDSKYKPHSWCKQWGVSTPNFQSQCSSTWENGSKADIHGHTVPKKAAKIQEVRYSYLHSFLDSINVHTTHISFTPLCPSFQAKALQVCCEFWHPCLSPLINFFSPLCFQRQPHRDLFNSYTVYK